MSRVEVSNPKLYSVTYSDKKGYFIFDRIIIPKNSGEYCLISIDEFQRSSPSLCLPPPPQNNTLTDIGPIIMAPTLSQDKGSKELVTSGQSVPNSKVNIQLFQVESKPKLVKEVQAFSLPQFSTTTDQKGNFSLNLPTQYSSEYRYYATVITPDLLASAKSNILWYQNPSTTNYLLFILLSIAVIIISTIIFFTKYKKRPIIYHYLPAIRPNYWPRRII